MARTTKGAVKAGQGRKRTSKRRPPADNMPAPRLGRLLSSGEEVRVIAAGAPTALARALQAELGLTQRELAKTLGIAHRTLVERMKKVRFDDDGSDRVLRLKRIYEAALGTFEGDTDATLRWLRSSNRALGGQVPLDLLATGSGARAVEQVLLRMEYGVFS